MKQRGACKLCSQFGPGPNGTHKFDDDTGTDRNCLSFPEEWTNCHSQSMEGGCYSQHYDCFEELPASADVLLAATDVRALAELRRTHPTAVRINHGRQALQVYDCRGQVVAHINIAAAVVAALQH